VASKEILPPAEYATSEPALTVGKAATVPVPVAISTEVALVLDMLTLPLAPLLASLFNLVYTVVELIVPLFSVSVKLEPKPEPDVEETSYPVGAEIEILASKLDP
jgi:hypothetical protein